MEWRTTTRPGSLLFAMAPLPDGDSTLEASSAASQRPPVITLRTVFSGTRGIVEREVRVLRETDGELSAGRHPDCPLAFPKDRLLSREHASFRARGLKVQVTDLGSRNGVVVDGHRVERTELGDGDVVRIGATFLVVRTQDPHQLDVADPTIMGLSPAMQTVRVAVRRLAASKATLLVTGETGTGKEVVARALHRASGRSGPFVAVNCSAISPSLAESELFGHVAGAFTGARADHTGYFRAAERGTLLLDEIGDMPTSLQPKLLRALETSTVTPVGSTSPVTIDTRVIAATHRDLESMTADGDFREDLLARVAQLRLTLPPLCERREDILTLLAKQLPEGHPPLAPSLVEALLSHPWRRNVREVVAVAAELALWGGAERLELDHVKAHIEPPEGPAVSGEEAIIPESVADWEALLRQHRGNLAAIARAVGRSRTQVYRLLDKHDLDPSRYREG